jgi:SAM-dependent methyltransferase
MPGKVSRVPQAPPRLTDVVTTDAVLTPAAATDVEAIDVGHGELVADYEDRFTEAIESGGSIYIDMGLLVGAGHERKLELLDGFDVGDLRDAVVVDFGVGSWGFAGIYPRLHACGLAIGIDISPSAVRESARVSTEGDFAYGDRWAYLTSAGEAMALRDGSVDLLFAGEVIEHVDHPDAFLDEIHRVLRPGGQLVLTTPNADAPLWRSRDEDWCVGPEHIALMGWEELRGRLEPRFELVEATGFNMSFHHLLDGGVRDVELARRWAALPAGRPDLANGIVVHCRRRDDWQRPRHELDHVRHDDPRLRWTGGWEQAELANALTGRRGQPGDEVELRFTGTGLTLQLWMHQWSGHAEVRLDDRPQIVDLWSEWPGFKRLAFDGLADGEHVVRVRATGGRRPASLGSEVLLHHAIVARSTR